MATAESSTKNRVLEVALRLFSEHGYRGTTTALIAREAGVAEGTLYRYFKDKKGLFMASIEPVIQEAIRRESALGREGSPRELLRHRIRERVRVIQEYLPVFNILFTESRYHPEIAELLIQRVAQIFSPAEVESMRAAVAAGQFRKPPNPLILTVGLTAAIWAMVQVGPAADALFKNWPSPASYDQLGEDLADLFADACCGPA